MNVEFLQPPVATREILPGDSQGDTCCCSRQAPKYRLVLACAGKIDSRSGEIFADRVRPQMKEK